MRFCINKTLSTNVISCLQRIFTRPSPIFVGVVLLLWLAGVIFTLTNHEFWRDEVRALSIARKAILPIDFYELLRNEGHPFLWYLLLYIGKSMADTPLVLPIMSVMISFASVVIFIFFAPFPFLVRVLFIFSLPFYEYSVIARNYGISVLLLFVCAAIYRNRLKYPFLLAFILALLANTNIHSAILTCSISFLWIWDFFTENRDLSVKEKFLSLCLPISIVLAGVLLCIIIVTPSKDIVATDIYSVKAHDVIISFISALLRPGQSFSSIVQVYIPYFVVSFLLYLCILGLLPRPNICLSAITCQIAFCMFFDIVYYGSYRHQGLFLVYIIFLYWLYLESSGKEFISKIKRLLFYMGYTAMIILILLNLPKATKSMWDDIYMERSSSREFGRFLSSSEAYRNAIIISEPDYLIESLPYYVTNKIYIPREHHFSTTATWTTKSDYNLSLGRLLSTALDIRAHYGRPVLIVLGHREVDNNRSGEKKYPIKKVFKWDDDDIENFKRLTILVAEFKNALSDENYKVFAIR